jgi:hypothetical protein
MELSTVQTLIADYSQRSPEQQIRVLCLLSFYLTLTGRSLYGSDTSVEDRAQGLKIINEIQHSIVSQVGPLLEDSPKRYPDDVFINIIIEKSGELREAVIWDLQEALPRTADQR